MIDDDGEWGVEIGVGSGECGVWSGLKRGGVEWSGMEWSGGEWNGMEWIGAEQVSQVSQVSE